MSVVMPQQKQKQDSMGKLLTIGGAVAGGAVGGPTGAMAGAQAGQMANGLLAKDAKPSPQPVESTAMQRRMQGMEQSQQNIRALREADSALAYLPPEQAAQYAPTIKRARQLAESEIA